MSHGSLVLITEILTLVRWYILYQDIYASVDQVTVCSLFDAKHSPKPTEVLSIVPLRANVARASGVGIESR